MKSGPRLRRAISSASSTQKACWPTADLIPTGIRQASATRSTKSISSPTVENSAWWAGLATVMPTGTPRAAAISGVTLAAGRTPPRPGFAPWLSLISMARIGARSTWATAASRSKRPSGVPGPEIAGAELVDELGTVEVMVADPALAGVVETVGHPGAPVHGLDRRCRERAEAHGRDTDQRGGTEGLGPVPPLPKHLGRREVGRRLVAAVARRITGPGRAVGEGGVADQRVGGGRRACCRCRKPKYWFSFLAVA